ncbi:P-type DNA transfer ATPase VirB11 [Methylovirgula sp. 4M-Z18]|uniref:P-type DNA transfer ATPase VirB11 n=1 Tax=Methylovirgula sp. 4M-Z18 TaxID=2293567 RepID=UPI000E2FB3A3|nr:P-type DNA transfer ATPase VirB11 [Methylovirgula sp. 4M-Z18]RFB76676.1 P-type DNA transfer ATPase VirB11 [Methylovirgula sp. 4M-Z18]
MKTSKDTSVLHFLEPFTEWLEQPDVTEICSNRADEVFVERNGKWERHDAPITYDHMRSLGTAVAKFSSNEFSDTRPVLSAILPKGQRVQFVMPPACEDGTISMTIRKPSFLLRDIETYVEQGFFSKIRPIIADLSEEEMELVGLYEGKDYARFLQRAVRVGKVIVVAGATGSGKTTFMKALMQEIPKSQRLITIEDVPELFLPNHPNHVHLFYPSEAKEEENAPITSASLLRSCMRMKPDRILLAELRGPETYDFVNICASGHGGSITSVHAGSAELAFERLSLMMLQNRQGRAIPYEVIRQMLYSVIDIVFHIRSDGTERHITEIWFDPAVKRQSVRH